ncbi:polyketide synthase [Jatrophihabitans lederbergiae]|uniref:Acyltransferase domain-containing protein n=1 Tax=Jatrophihabitans lederbergiae TaxID=3075547 RepID=A0ABU2JHU6_9ACTN|nr:polyketide synthase [Jatrophihabitans sp. DSM 44399]MDT0263828.1 acyltransferase domain-containing protein [Jatrophihabitans sp. DSM 44399]
MPAPSVDSVLRALQVGIGILVGSDPETLTADSRFVDTGLDSLRARSLVEELSARFDTWISPTAVWKYPTLAEFAAHVVASNAPVPPTAPAGPRTPPGVTDEPIAVVGVGCRFPTGNNPSAFWDSLTAGRDGVGPVPSNRRRLIPAAAMPSVGGRQIPVEAGYLDWSPDEFDPVFFGISPREAAEMDPQQRLLLEVAWEALENAGLTDHDLVDSRTGVFIGAIWHDFADLLSASEVPPGAHTATGQASNMIANRLSYVLGLRGVSVTIDSACSSSLLAVHLACQSLRLGESDTAVAGGVNLILGQRTTAALTGFGGLSPDGRCKTFDSRADGFGRGEGCGVVVLKRLSSALADGDRIWATVRGTAANNDGPTNGLTAPSSSAQEDVLSSACAQAGVAPSAVQYVECHGTGTALGDPIEADALGAVLGTARTGEPLLIGSVKSNIGHLEAAAGVAGFIKTVLAVRHGQIPPNLHLIEPNPDIRFDELGLRVPTELLDWPAPPAARLAGVSAFGWGGTNVHAVLAGWDDAEPVSPPELDEAVVPASAIAFVCSPHGHAWLGMGRQLYRHEPVFRDRFGLVSTEYRLHSPIRLAEVLFQDEDRLDADDVTVMQPLQFAVQLGIAEWLRSREVLPNMVFGHSLGEITAAVIAGMIDLPDAVRLLFHYCAQQKRVSGPDSGMAIAEITPEEAAALPEVLDGRLVIAAENGPRSTALAGRVADLAPAIDRVKALGRSAAMIRVNVSAHSPAIDAVLPDLRAAISSIRLHPGRIPMISTVTGLPLDGAGLSGDYFATNLRRPVLLAAATRHALDAGCDLLLEISANPVLTEALAQSVRETDSAATVLGSGRRPDELSCLRRVPGRLGRSTEARASRPDLVTIAARSAQSLRQQTVELAAALHREPGTTSLAEVVWTTARRADGAHRLAVVAEDIGDLCEQLIELGGGGSSARAISARSLTRRPGGVAFVFPGQGSQWLTMGRDLYADEPVFAAMIDRCDAAAREFVSYSITGVLLGTEPDVDVSDIDVLQPVLFAIEVALAQTWRGWGVEPAAVIGHSMGEAAAAYVAGAVTLRDAVKVLCVRSRLMRRMSGRGAMLSVELGVEELQDALDPHRELVSVAVSNSPRSTVLSGDEQALEEIRSGLEGRGEFCRWVKVDVASHSPQMDGLLPELRELLDDVSGSASLVPMYSTVTGQVEDGSRLTPQYWCDNLRLPVLFGSQIAALIERGTTAFVEMSPHPVLLTSIESVATQSGTAAVTVASLRRDAPGRETMLGGLGALWAHGVGFARGSTAPPARSNLELPGYPWDRQRHWPAIAPGGLGHHRIIRGLQLSERLDPVGEPGVHYWQIRLGTQVSSIGDHRFGGSAVVPGAVHLELISSAAAQLLESESLLLSDVVFHRPLGLDDDGTGVALQIQASDSGDALIVRVYALGHCVAEAGARRLDGYARPPALDLTELTPALTRYRDAETFYHQLAETGLDLGAGFRGLVGVHSREGEAVAEIAVPPGRTGDETCLLNPALLDAALQTALAVQPEPDAGTPRVTLVSRSVDEIVVGGPLTGPARVHSRRNPTPLTELGSVDVDVCAADGSVVVALRGIRLSEIDLAAFTATSSADPTVEAAHPAEAPARTAIGELTTASARSAAAIALVLGEVSAAVRLEPDRIDTEQPLRELGLDSAMALEVRNRLEALFGLRLRASLTFNYPTVRAVARFLLHELSLAEPDAAPAARAEPASPVVRPEPVGVPATDIDRELDDLASWIGQS